ncbi:hypothetical protein ACPOL_5249 [Acidisarcina polymorpha]|uniref:Uncharacterized protein n=2 Tax=Acidisarcina polymorpha TaxID=2211140 RepID=A0A2Z5G5J7_9BACT|nr:hypothetical protein ACPOL_5249 [Acidisarcina polymorpha]
MLFPALASLSLVASAGSGQLPDSPQLPTGSSQQPTNRVPFGQQGQDSSNQDPSLRHAMQEAAGRRNTDRQTRMVADTNRLVKLAEELKDDMEKGGTSGTLGQTKKAEEIEKLARSVKDRMKAD